MRLDDGCIDYGKKCAILVLNTAGGMGGIRKMAGLSRVPNIFCFAKNVGSRPRHREVNSRPP